MAKRVKSVRLADETWKDLDRLSEELGVSVSRVLEMAVQEYAARRPPAGGERGDGERAVLGHLYKTVVSLKAVLEAQGVGQAKLEKVFVTDPEQDHINGEVT